MLRTVLLYCCILFVMAISGSMYWMNMKNDATLIVNAYPTTDAEREEFKKYPHAFKRPPEIAQKNPW